MLSDPEIELSTGLSHQLGGTWGDGVEVGCLRIARGARTRCIYGLVIAHGICQLPNTRQATFYSSNSNKGFTASQRPREEGVSSPA